MRTLRCIRHYERFKVKNIYSRLSDFRKKLTVKCDRKMKDYIDPITIQS